MRPLVLLPFTEERESRVATLMSSLRYFWGFQSVGRLCTTDFDYSIFIRNYWNWGGDIIILEHDIVPTLQSLTGLAECAAGVCGVAYKLHPVTTGLKTSNYAYWSCDGGRHWIGENEEMGKGAIGFLKIARWLREICQVPEMVHWRELDSAIWKVLPGTGHIHWPEVEHLHQ